MSVTPSIVQDTTAPLPWGQRRPHPTTAQITLWEHIHGDTTGLIAAFSGRRVRGKKDLQDETSRYFEWPAQRIQASQWLIGESDRDRDAYMCAHLVTKKRRVKANAATMIALYVDGDGAQVGPELPQPTAIIESSPGRQQFYWRLTKPVDPIVGEQLNKRLAKAMGADMSGWDLTQLLRPPGTRNYKYQGAPEVRIQSIEDRAYDPDELDRILPPLPAPAPKAEPRPAGRATGDAAAILTRMQNGKRGAELGDWYHRGHGAGNANAIDLSFHNATAFYSDRDPVVMDQLHRSSALMRDKWDEVHYADGTTYGQHTIDKAIADCHTSIGDLVARAPKIAFPEPAPTVEGAEAPDELAELRAKLATAEAEVERRGGVIDNLADVIHVQQVRLSTLEAEHADCRATFQAMKDVVSNKHLRGNETRVALVATWEMDSQRSRGIDTPKMSLAAVSERSGVSTNTASRVIQQLSEGDDAPFEREVTRTLKTGPDGTSVWVSSLLVRPRSATAKVSETLRAVANYVPDRAQHGGSPQATAARWQCREHPDSDVIVTATARCASCENVVGEPKVTVVKADRTLNHQVGDSDNTPLPVDDYVTLTHQLGDSDEFTLARADRIAREAVAIEGREIDPDKRVTPPESFGAETLGRIPFSKPAPPGSHDACAPLERPAPPRTAPWRCPECPALERRMLPDGSSRCVRGHVSPDIVEVAG